MVAVVDAISVPPNRILTVALNDSASVLDRYAYAPYGEVTFLNADFSVRSSQESACRNTLTSLEFLCQGVMKGSGLFRWVAGVRA